MSKHTSGPWVWSDANACVSTADTGEVVAKLQVMTEEHGGFEALAGNGKLIAAAEDLLVACKIAVYSAKHNRISPTQCWTTCGACVIKQAIAKAEGAE